MKKLLLVGLMLGIASIVTIAVHPAAAVPPATVDIFGTPLHDGDLISANQSAGDPDIFIIKLKGFTGYATPGANYGDYNGFKRLFLNPAIFSMYGHLGGYAKVHQVTAAVRDSFVTSGLFRNCETNEQKVWATEVTGEDNGVLHHVQMTGDQASAEDGRFFDKVFCINSREDDYYPKSITPYTRIADIPQYFRRACQVRPVCLDATPSCSIPEPVEGWCPGTTPTPPPGCYYQQVQCIRAPCDPVLVCPTPTPTTTTISQQATVTSAQIPTLSTYQSSALVTFSGYLPTPCYTLDPVTVGRVGWKFLIGVSASAVVSPNSGACVQITRPFSSGAVLDLASAPVGQYDVVINGTTFGTIYRHGIPTY
ncbi:MAG: hypothetical protein IT406_03650 [Candidatus Yanofskybacteria bacterium]|nr:hypothetical protein [Candidatus Yanofskybacteria bacterium]